MRIIPVRDIEITQAKDDFTDKFNIVKIQSVLDSDMVQEAHRHNFYFILVLENGIGKHIVDLKPFSLLGNSIFFLRPGQVHSLVIKTKSKGYIVRFNPNFISDKKKMSNDLLRKVSHTNYYKLEEQQFAKVMVVLHRIYDEFVNREEAFQRSIKANLDILFIELNRNKNEKITNKNSVYDQERFEEFLQLLETNVTKYKQVSQYTKLLSLSSYQLNSITKRLVGKTCSTLINEQVVLEAKRQLLVTSNQINQIAYYLGYEDASYFNRFFKKHTGHSPDFFRKNFK